MDRKIKIKLASFFLRIYTFFFGKLRPKESLDSQYEFERIVVYSTTALGDLMLNTPAIRALRERYPDASIIFVSSYQNKNLVKDYHQVDHILYWNNKFNTMFKLIRELKCYQPQLAVILHSHAPYDLISAICSGVQYVLRDSYDVNRLGLDDWCISLPKNYNKHIIQRKLDLLSFIDCNNKNVDMEIPFLFNNEKYKKNDFIVGFQMGASHLIKCWPVSNFVQLAKIILERHQSVHITLIGSPGEVYLSKEFFKSLPSYFHSRIIDKIGRTTLLQLVSTIDDMNVLITGDTGPQHVAIALNIPVIVLFSSENPESSGPYNHKDLHQIIYEPLVSIDNSLLQPLGTISSQAVYEKITFND